MAIPIITAGDIDLMAAKLQLAELQQEVARARDAQLALQLFFEDAGGAQVDASAVSVSSAGGFELELLQEQMANLSAVISTAEDSQAALGLVDAEEAQQAASLQAASALQAQEQWDATVLRPHDEALARAIAACDEWEWQERGEWIEHPLDISSRPQQPAGEGNTQAPHSWVLIHCGRPSHAQQCRTDWCTARLPGLGPPLGTRACPHRLVIVHNCQISSQPRGPVVRTPCVGGLDVMTYLILQFVILSLFKAPVELTPCSVRFEPCLLPAVFTS